MRQAELDRAVARATQESVGVIRNMGFTLMVTPPMYYRPQSRRRSAEVRSKPPQPATAGRRAG